MSETDRNIIEYDISILKKNIKNLMKEKHITQTALANKAGMDQPRISAILSGKSSDCFTVPQLVYIARALNVSTDTLLGLDTPKAPEHELCMSDVCSKLFDLDKISDMKIGYCRTGEYEKGSDIFQDPVEIEVPGIYFDNDKLSDFLAEWKELESSGIGREETKSKVLELWKAETIKDASQRKRKWEYRTELEESKNLQERLLEELNEYSSNREAGYCPDGLSGVWLESELKLIDKYNNVHSSDYDSIMYAIKLVRNSKNGRYIPDHSISFD